MQRERGCLSTDTKDRESSPKPRNVGSLLEKGKETDSHLNSAKGTALKNYFDLLTIKIDACAVWLITIAIEAHTIPKYRSAFIHFCIYIFLHFYLHFHLHCLSSHWNVISTYVLLLEWIFKNACNWLVCMHFNYVNWNIFQFSCFAAQYYSSDMHLCPCVPLVNHFQPLHGILRFIPSYWVSLLPTEGSAPQ